MALNNLLTLEQARTFIFAGKATFTLKSLKTGNHFTYKVNYKKQNPSFYFVSVLYSSDKYACFGRIFPNDPFTLVLNKKTHIGRYSKQTLALEALLTLLKHGKTHKDLEFWHEGHCGVCGRKLTHPNSIKLGIGKQCLDNQSIF